MTITIRKEQFETEREMCIWLRRYQAEYTSQLGLPEISSSPLTGAELQIYPDGLHILASGGPKTILVYRKSNTIN